MRPSSPPPRTVITGPRRRYASPPRSVRITIAVCAAVVTLVRALLVIGAATLCVLALCIALAVAAHPALVEHLHFYPFTHNNTCR